MTTSTTRTTRATTSSLSPLPIPLKPPGFNSCNNAAATASTAATINLYNEKEVMEEFISCYRHFPALWDSSCNDYQSTEKKAPGYQELLKILRRINSECSVYDVKRKINSLRSCYRREYKKIDQSHDGYEPRLWWFHMMDFLMPVLNLKPLSHKKKNHHQIETKNEISIHLDDGDEVSMNDEEFFGEQPFEVEEDVLNLDGSSVNSDDLELDTLKIKNNTTSDYNMSKRNRTGVGGPHRGFVSHKRLETMISVKPKAKKQHRKQQQQNRCHIDNNHDNDDSDDDDDDYMTAAKKRRSQTTTDDQQTENECVLIGKRMAAHFRNMRLDQRLYAERIISEVLVYGRMNRLTLEARFLPSK